MDDDKAMQIVAMFTAITGLTIDDLLDAKSEEELLRKVAEALRRERLWVVEPDVGDII